MKQSLTTLIFPVACDMHVVDGNPILGYEAKASCIVALWEAWALLGEKKFIIMPTAGEDPRTGIVHSEIMEKFLHGSSPWGDDARVPIESARASAFNTEGEVKALVWFVKKGHDGFPEQIDEIVVCCKWWHMPRTVALLKYHLWRAGLRKRVRCACCTSRASWKAIVLEFIGAWPKNILRIFVRDVVRREKPTFAM